MKSTGVKYFAISILFALITTGLFAQHRVDEFSGDFSYSIPGVTVSGPNGESVSVGFNYAAGVRVDQGASDIGLGWNMSGHGVILRERRGVPDDWKTMRVPTPGINEFRTHNGVLYINESTGDSAQEKDFYLSRYKLDMDEEELFLFPDYDQFYVKAPGITAQMQLNYYAYGDGKFSPGGTLYDFDVADSAYFTFKNDFHDSLNSRYFGIGDSVIYNKPDEQINGSAIAFEGPSYNATAKGLKVARYIEYKTNLELGRTGDEYDLNGIGAIYITEVDGSTYHFTIPVYANYEYTASFPLSTEGIPREKDGWVTVSDTGGYYSYDSYNRNVEFNISKKYATKWLLTKITGLNYNDENSNGVADDGDTGYWISYDYQKWADEFRKPNVYYGNTLIPSFDSNTEFFPMEDTTKEIYRGVYNEMSEQVYVLNKIVTSTQTALFVRDVRKDEFGMHSFWKTNHMRVLEQQAESQSQVDTNWVSHLLDEGGTSDYTTGTYLTTFSPVDADSVEIRFNSFDIGGSNGSAIDLQYDKLYVYDGADTNATLLGTYYNAVAGSSVPASLPPSTLTSSSGSITIRLDASVNDLIAGYSRGGFDISWKALWSNNKSGWDNGRPQSTPALKLSRVILYNNDEMGPLPSEGTISSYGRIWNTSEVAADTNFKIYNDQWYQDNSLTIDSSTIRSIELVQDYGLCKDYWGNIDNWLDSTDKFTSYSDVINNVIANTAESSNNGKLSLTEVIRKERSGIQVHPSTILSYNESDTLYNPDFNPFKKDYWGFYNSHAQGVGFGGYHSSFSADQKDAWSLFKITTPLGGEIEMAYESDNYSGVLADTVGGGIRGPSKIYAIKSMIADTLGKSWTLTLEHDDSTFISELSNAVETAHIPFVAEESCIFNSGERKRYINNGTTFNLTAGYNINSLKFYDVGGAVYDGDPAGGYFSTCDSTEILYGGRGFINLDYAAGNEVVGGGIRITKITTRNTSTETYATTYDYQDGVATAESHWYNYLETYEDANSNELHSSLSNFRGDRHQMSPKIGYGKVTIKKLGQGGLNNGEIVREFINTDEDFSNFEPTVTNIVRTTYPDATTTVLDSVTVMEVGNKLASLFGSMKSSTTIDAFGNPILKSVNTYGTPVKGAKSEHHHIRYRTRTVLLGGGFTRIENFNLLPIKRDYGLRLMSQIKYSQGQKSIYSVRSYDGITGLPTETLLETPDGTQLVTTQHAFRDTNYSKMGAKSEDTLNVNLLMPKSFTKVTPDTSYSGNNDFLSYTANTFTDTIHTLDSQVVLTYLVPKSTYSWKGELGTYGLYDADSLVEFNYNEPDASSSKWRLDSEIELMDDRYNVLESSGINSRLSAKKYGYEDRFAITGGSNVSYESFTFTNFEDIHTHGVSPSLIWQYGGDFLKGNGTDSDGTDDSNNVTPHTGDKVIYLKNSGATITDMPRYEAKLDDGLQKDRYYRALVWVHESAPSTAGLVVKLEGSTAWTKSMYRNDPDTIKAGEWIQLRVEFEIPSSWANSGDDAKLTLYLSNTSSTGAFFDDLLFRPSDVAIGGGVFDKYTERSVAQINPEGFATKTLYKEGDRAIEIYQEIEGTGFQLVKKTIYNIQNQ